MPDTSWPWNILTPYMGGAPSPPSPQTAAMEQALQLPQFGMADGALQQMRDQADQRAATQTALMRGGLFAGGELPAWLGVKGIGLAASGAADLAGHLFDMSEDQRASNIYNQALSDTINNTLTAQARAQSQNSGGGILRGFLGP